MENTILNKENEDLNKDTDVVFKEEAADSNEECVFNKGASREELLRDCQLSEGELSSVLHGTDKHELFICETDEADHYAFFDPL